MYRSFPTPWSYNGGIPATVEQKAKRLTGQPVGISLKNGKGVSGVICSVDATQVYVLQYLYAFQFATFHYEFQEIQDILPFPPCQ
ncbi:hypothetical protein [Gorillibacterium sp. sgz5001074]|uniref:hypothetical protein n=1 Tax=Gorillibacterium sp. sgz5001074 TaxID=3446695 RepID=UPI003F67996E